MSTVGQRVACQTQWGGAAAGGRDCGIFQALSACLAAQSGASTHERTPQSRTKVMVDKRDQELQHSPGLLAAQRNFQGTAVFPLEDPKPPIQSEGGVGASPGHGPVVCGQVPAPPGPTSWPRHSRDFQERKTTATTRGSHNLKLGKPKPTPGLLTGHHGGRETGRSPAC